MQKYDENSCKRFNELFITLAPDGNAACGGGGAGGGGSVASGCIAGGGCAARGHQQLTWEKLSPEEFQQLQDFAACKF